MQLPGRLERTTLGDLLGRLHRARASGALEIDALGRRHQVQLRRGLVAAVTLDMPSPPARLGDVLVSCGVVSREALEATLRTQQSLGSAAPTHGELLVARGEISPDVRDAALRRQTRARLDWLYAFVEREVTGATIRFHVGVGATVPPPRARISSTPPAAPAPLLPHDFLHGRSRARDRDAAPSPRASTVSSSPPPPPTVVFDRLRALRALGLSIGADASAIRRAFREAASRLHPDRHPSATTRERARLHEAFSELSAAYHLLTA